LSLKNLPQPRIPRRAIDRLKEAVIESIKEKKGEDVVSLDLTGIQESVTDCFVICTAGSKVQAKAIADFVEEHVRKGLNEKPYHIEGLENMEWVLIDYVDVVVHIFLEKTRTYYDIEDIWSDAPVTEYN